MTNDTEPTNDEMYLAKMTMDEVGADIEKHGFVPVTPDTATVAPFSPKGILINELGGVTMPDTVAEDSSTLAEELDSIAMDSEEVIESEEKVEEEEEEDNTEKNKPWDSNPIPAVPKSLGGDDEVDENGLVYITRLFTVDPALYRSANYMPLMNNAAKADFKKKPVKPMPQNGAEKASQDIDAEIEKFASDLFKDNVPALPKAPAVAQDEAVAEDWATVYDNTSYYCYNESSNVDYSKIAMDAGVKKAPTKQTCKTTFAQCRAENPLFCRFHGPKLLEKDIKSYFNTAGLKGCTVSVTKDKGQKNPLTFRLTVGCVPAKKEAMEDLIHQLLTQNPGLKEIDDFKDVGNNKMSLEFEMDIVKADEPPAKNDLKGQAALWEVKKAKAQGKTMPVVGETPPKIEKLAKQGGVQKTDEQPPVEEVKENTVTEKEDNEQITDEDVKDFLALKGLTEETNKSGKPFSDDIKAWKALATGKPIPSNGMSLKDFDPKGLLEDIDGIESHKVSKAILAQMKKLGMPTVMEGEKDKNLVSEVKGMKGENKDEGDAKKESAIAKVKEGLKGTPYENSKLTSYEEDGGSKVIIASTLDKASMGMDIELYGYVNAAGELSFGVQIGNDPIPKSSLKEAIEMFGEYGGTPDNGETEGGSNKEATFAKIKDVLDKGFEDGDQQIDLVKSLWDIVSEADSDDDLAKDIRETLLDCMELDDEGYPTIDKDIDVGNYDSPMIYAIHQIQSLVDKYEDELDDSKNAPSGFDDDAKKMMGEIDDMAHQYPELVNGDAQVSALFYAAQNAINYIDASKQELEEIDEKYKKVSNEPKNAANTMILIALDACKKKQQEAYDEAKANAELSVKDFKAAVEKANAAVMDSIKGTNEDMVENIVKTTELAIFPQGKPDGVDSVVEMIDALHVDMTSFAKEKLGENVDLLHEYMKSYKKNKLNNAWDAVSSASHEFDAAVKEFKDLIDGVKSKDGAESLKEAVNGISEYSQKLKDAFATYKMAVENVKKDVSALAELKENEKKLSQNNAEKPIDAAVPKTDAKNNVASMSQKEKMEKAIPLLEQKIKAEPNNPKWQNMLNQAKSYIASASSNKEQASATTTTSQKPDVSSMSKKEKMEKSIPLLEKKIKEEPDNQKWKDMLKYAKSYLESI